MAAETRSARWARVTAVASAVLFAAHTCPPDDAMITDVGQVFETNPVFELTNRLIAGMPCDEQPLPAVLSDTVQLVVTALTGDDTFESEVHDCQRLVREGVGTFGSLMGVFPLAGAMELTELTDPTVVATIYNWGLSGVVDLEGYPELNIPDDMSWGCLWVDKPGRRAKIVDVRTSNESACTVGRSFAPEADEYDLTVEVHSDSLAVPPTARWRWDHGLGLHYIGVRCGTEWCSIYGDPSITRTSERTFGSRAIHAGNYDEQRLAVPDGSGGLTPGPVAWVAPAPLLATTDSVQLAAAGDTLLVGEIELDVTTASDPAEVQVYVDKYGLEATSDPDIVWAEIFLTTESLKVDGDVDQNGGFGSGGSSRAALAVALQANAKHAAMGATRWRWMTVDEGMWYSCDRGCCTMFGPGGDL